ncbi:hypothetical protein UlMin_025884 [Ulmus minor]
MAQEHLHFLRSNRKVTDSQASQIRNYKCAGLRTCDIVNLMVHQSGGFERLGFIRKDAYNKEKAIHQAKTVETDAEGLLGYLTLKIDSSDPTLFVKYAIDDSNPLGHIFWSDSISQRDYMCCTDALAFDTTYRTNAFHKPLVIFVGVNNHFRTCVFGFALLMNETIDTYTWVLEAFLECMQERTPRVVITDRDTSMKASIMKCFPDAVHRLCGWHLSTNATTNIKSPQFTKAFRNLLYKHYNIPRWYEKWEALLDKFELHTNAWVDTTYANRFSWVEKFMKTHFFGGMTTTKRCESINSYLKNFVNCKLPLREFIRHVDIALRNIRQTEQYDDFISFSTKPPYPIDAALISYLK